MLVLENFKIKIIMKKTLLIVLISTGLSLTNYTCSSNDNKSKNEIIVKQSDIEKKCIGVDGMTCVGCEVTLEHSLSKIEGVISVRASASNDEAIIEFDKSKTDVKTITKAIETAGYKPFDKN